MMLRSLALFALLPAVLPAQRTWVVDAAGGGNFTQIQPAVDAASAGDTILVRNGGYRAFVVRGKGLSILGGGQVRVAASNTPRSTFNIIASSIPSGQRLVLSGMVMGPPTVSIAVGIQITNCADVHLQDMRSFLMSATGVRVLTGQAIQAGFLDIDNCRSVVLTDPVIGPSSVLIPALGIENSRVTVAGGRIYGNPPLGLPIFVESGQLFLSGDARTLITAGGSSVPAIRVGSAGMAYVDPNVTLRAGGTGPVIVGPFVRQPIPSLRAAVSANVLSTRLFAPGALRGHTLLGLPQSPIVLPAAIGDLWIGTAHVVVDTGSMPSNGIRAATISLPTSRPAGIMVTLQGLVARPGGAIQLSTPVRLTLDG